MADIVIGGRLHSAATGNTVAGANEIMDDAQGKKQSVVNQETNERFNAYDTAILGRYTNEEINNIISNTPETDVIVVDIPAASQSDIAGWLDANTPSGTDPETGKSVRANKLYRVPGPDNHSYSEWAWDGTAYIMLANKDYGIDDVPTIRSNNFVKSGGVFEKLTPLYPVFKSTYHVMSEHTAEILNYVQFKQGQRVLLYIKTLPDFTSLTVSGNIVYDGSSVQYPQVTVRNGLGILDFVASDDGHLGSFGFQSYPGYEFDLLFEAYVVDSGYFPLIEKINETEEKVIINREDVEYALGERTYSKTLAVSSRNASTLLDIDFSEKEIIVLEVFTDSNFNGTISGNARFQDDSRAYPQVSVVDGYGKIILGYSKSGKLESFGFSQYPGQDFNIKFIVRINEERQDTILNKTQNTCPFSDDTLQITSEKLTKNLTNIVFKAGQRICMYISCNPNVSVTCYGNIFYNDQNPVYPKITVYEGRGYLEFVAAYDGNLGPFGLISYPGEDFDMNFRTFITNNDYPVLQRIDDIERTVQKAISNIESSIGETIEERYLTISQYTKSTDLDVLFNANDTIIIEVFVNPSITGTINGNVKFTDESLVYPQVPVVDGYGKLSLKYNKSGKLWGFGVQNYTQDMAVRFLIHVIGTDENSIINNIEPYNKTDFLPSISESPVRHILETPGFTAIFRSWGFVGDSLSSGEMECYEGSTLKYVDMYEYSWGQHICRLCGSEGYNYSQAGQTARGWITGTGERTWEGARTNPKQAYIIALGVNDYQAEPGNIDTDIDMNDYNNNANTFAGNYGGIIQRLRSIQPKCKIFVVTMPSNSNKNPIIRGMADKFDNVYVIDLYQYRSFYESSEFQTKYKLNGHLNPQGYLWTAYLFMTYIDWIIQNNPGNFKDVALIGTQYTPIGA